MAARPCEACGLPLPPREPGTLGPPRRLHPGCTREASRHRRPRAVRARSIRRLSQVERAALRALYPEAEHLPPLPARSECRGGPRPCPLVRCRYHLYLDVQARTGAIKFNFPDVEIEDMTESCALDAADRGGCTLEEVGQILNLTRERIRMLEVAALAQISESEELSELAEDEERRPVRRLPILDGPDEDDPDLDDDREDDEAHARRRRRAA